MHVSAGGLVSDQHLSIRPHPRDVRTILRDLRRAQDDLEWVRRLASESATVTVRPIVVEIHPSPSGVSLIVEPPPCALPDALLIALHEAATAVAALEWKLFVTREQASRTRLTT
jgi:hypothetical protein